MSRLLPRFIVLGLLLAAATSTTRADDPWIHGIYTGESPRPVTLAESEAWHQASSLAEETADAFVLVGSGQSMQPLYQPGTILVLRQLTFSDLKRGQTVLYRNKNNKVVAHVLVAKARDGWRARGLNNRIHDMEPVHAENLVGVVVAAYRPVGPRAAVTLAAVAPFKRTGLN
jgi:signal peptidase I